MHTRITHLAVTCVVIYSACCSILKAGEQRKWTSADGKFSVMGEMIGFADDLVVIEKENQGGMIRVPLAKLSQADRDFADAFKRKALGVPESADATVVAGPDDKWTLNAQVKMRLPPDAKQWKVVSKDPARFRAERQNKTSDYLQVECLPFMESEQRRISHVNQAIDESLAELTKLGATVAREPARLTANPPRRYVKVIEGKLKDGKEIEYHLTVRFDLEGCLTLCALGDHDYASKAIASANLLTYVNPATVAEVKPAARPGKNGVVPADKKKSLNTFIEKAKGLLKQGDIKAFFEAVVDPEDLKQIQKSTTLDELAKMFESNKQAELMRVLESLDWKTAEYSAEQKQVIFKREPPDRPMVFTETELGWRLKN